MNASPSPIRLLIVDDHPFVRMGVASFLNAQADIKVVGQAGSVEQAVQLFVEHHPDVTLMDLRLPDGSGVTDIKKILNVDPGARIIVLTTYEGDDDIHQALAAGALGYLIKGMSQQALLQALQKVRSGQRFIPSVISSRLSERMPWSVLSQREREVLQFMFRGKSNLEIANLLEIRETTVKTHVRMILGKLGAKDRTQAVVEGLKRGIVHL